MDTILIPPLVNLLIGYSASIILGGFLIEWMMASIRKRSEVLSKSKSNVKKDLYLVRVLAY